MSFLSCNVYPLVCVACILSCRNKRILIDLLMVHDKTFVRTALRVFVPYSN